MKIALLQYPIVWANPLENLRLFGERLANVQGKADLALLPEMFTTGFCVNQTDVADQMDGITVSALRKWAADFDIAIAGSFMCRDNGRLYNRGFFIRPDGSADFIDKRHLYRSGGEATLFTAGNSRTVSEYKGVKFCLQVCYDLRFPVWMRNKSGHDYDILLFCAAWPESRIAAWDILIPARGIENQSFVAAVNTVGDDQLGLHYNGHSVAYDTRLHRLVHFDDNEQGTKIADFNVETLHHFRETLPLWQDGDPFTLS